MMKENNTSKMHSSAARIDGLTDWYNNHPAQIGDTVTIVINPDKSIKLALRKESQTQPQEESEEALSVTETVPNMERLVEDFLVTNLDHIEKGLKLYQDEKGIPGRQYSTDLKERIRRITTLYFVPIYSFLVFLCSLSSL